MELAAAKMIGAGIACIALVGAGIGIGNVFGSYLSGALRNPGAAATQTTNLLLGFALCEATGLFGLVCLLSLRARRPLMYFIGRALSAGDDPVKVAAYEELWEMPTAPRTFRLITGALCPFAEPPQFVDRCR